MTANLSRKVAVDGTQGHEEAAQSVKHVLAEMEYALAAGTSERK